MINLSLQQIAKAINGQLIGRNLDIKNVSIDSRETINNGLFVCIAGENFDGHDFAEKALEQGCIALLVKEKLDTDAPQIIVTDTLLALGDLANHVRKTVNPKVIGITGSAGKTTVKEMVSAILKNEGQVLATAGNFNNHIGVPLTLLRLTEQDKFAVVEMGANHRGEIACCCKVAQPNITTINNVAPAHIEGFGSVEGVAKAKSEIYQALNSGGVAVINLDDDFSESWMTEEASYQKVSVSCHKEADFSAHNVQINNSGCPEFELTYKQESVLIKLNMPGKHNVSNALVAAALAASAGASMQSIESGLQNVAQVAGRLNKLVGINNSLLIDDTYNASVISIKVAIDYLAGLSGNSILVLGDMAELGDESEKYHSEIGEYVKNANIGSLYLFGEEVAATARAFGAQAKLFTDKKQLIKELIPTITQESNILIKGSRSARMEQVVQALTQDEPQTTNQIGGCH